LENHHFHRGLCAATGIAAPMVLDGPMSGEAFLAYVEQAPVPEVRPTSSSWTICQSARSPGCGKPLRQPGQASNTSRTYRPDFNPIERASAKFKSLLRAAQARASGEPPTPFAASPRKNAQTISPPQDTMQRERKML
jgi:hypothetical protein